MHPEMEVEPIVVELPAQIKLLVPVDAAGSGFNVTTILLLFEQPVAVMVSVSVYVVVDNGFTEGNAEVELNPTGLETQE